jgi:hypothetical protein
MQLGLIFWMFVDIGPLHSSWKMDSARRLRQIAEMARGMKKVGQH